MKEWSARKAEHKVKKVDMSDYFGQPSESVGVVHVVHASSSKDRAGAGGSQIIKSDPDAQEVVVETTESQPPVKSQTTNVVVIHPEGSSVDMDINSLQQAVQEALGPNETIGQMQLVDASETDSAICNIPTTSTSSTTEPRSGKQQIVVADDGLVTVAIPENAYISQMPSTNDDDEDVHDGTIEDPITRKKSMVYGCRKTKLHTHRYK